MLDHPSSFCGSVNRDVGQICSPKKRTGASYFKDRLKLILGRSASVNGNRDGSQNGTSSTSSENKHSQFQEFLRPADSIGMTLCAKYVKLLTYRAWPNMHDNHFALYKLPTPRPITGQEYAGLWGGTFGWPPGKPSDDKPGKALFFLSLSYEESEGQKLLIATKILEGTHYVLHPNGSAMFLVKVDELCSDPFLWNNDGASRSVDVKRAYSGEGIANGYGFRYPGSKPGSLYVIQDGLRAFVWKESKAVLTLQRLNLQDLLKKGERVLALPPIVNFAYLTKSYSNVFTGFSNTTSLFSSFHYLPFGLFLTCSSLSAQSHIFGKRGSGIAGSSLAHFLRVYSSSTPQVNFQTIQIFEKNDIVGGRMATVSIGGDTFEAGASILHPRNLHVLNFTKLFNLRAKTSDEDDDMGSLGIWDGSKFLFKTIDVKSGSSWYRKFVSVFNSLRLLGRYGFSLFRMERFVKSAVDNFCKYYESFESRPVFESVEEMLKWAGLHELTTRTLEEELVDAGLSPLLISELVTVITRVNYGQSVSMSGLAGAVSLAGSGGGLWAVEGGNWQVDAGLIKHSDVKLHLGEHIESVSYLGGRYELNSTKGNSYICDVTVVATPLDEVNIRFSPPISIPDRNLQHTYTTFVRGLLNPAYFSLNSLSEIPELVGTVEDPDIPFSCISVLKKYSEEDMTYKMFSRAQMEDSLLDQIFSARKETIRINWGAYPHYKAPEVFAPFLLDGLHLYYVNAFENAASTMETSAVAAENVARLILSRQSSHVGSNLKRFASNAKGLHVDL
ncbi:hypothetical protein IFM89_001820 [Coptis chinensis]|uniref:Prenylcysteine lyase domain-containing protein n=1 Tax=Coptis chinensis TaxID=261450 RepID=A0A835LQJ1_9MAGN|nr:hypothetical protein IFM89_001820 [Coptis chinensis]